MRVLETQRGGCAGLNLGLGTSQAGGALSTELHFQPKPEVL